MNNFIKYPSGNPRSYLNKFYGIRSVINEITGSSCYKYQSSDGTRQIYWSFIKKLEYINYTYSERNE